MSASHLESLLTSISLPLHNEVIIVPVIPHRVLISKFRSISQPVAHIPSKTSLTMSIAHPYYPQNALLSGEIYTPNTYSVPYLITSFGALWTLLLITTLLAIRKYNPHLKISDQALILWFVLSKILYIIT